MEVNEVSNLINFFIYTYTVHICACCLSSISTLIAADKRRSTCHCRHVDFSSAYIILMSNDAIVDRGEFDARVMHQEAERNISCLKQSAVLVSNSQDGGCLAQDEAIIISLQRNNQKGIR